MKKITLLEIIVLSIIVMISGCRLIGQKPSADLCEKELRTACQGCDPYLERFRIVTDKLDDKAKTEVKKCVDTTVSATVKNVKYADAALKGCISSNTTLDEKVRDALLKEIDKVQVREEVFNAWLDCYKRYLSARGKTFEIKPVVVLMDSHIKDVVYCKHTQEIGGSNADDITNLIKDLPITINTVATNLEWQDDQRVIDLHPALVVLHASAFYAETQPMEGNKRLIDFLDSLKNTGIKILVYTRGLPAQPTKDVLDRWEIIKKKVPEVGNAELFVMPKGHDSCFTDPDVGRPFKEKIKNMLSLK